MTPVRLEPAALRSRVKPSTTEPLRSLSNCLDLMATKFTLELLSKIISKIRYSKSCILYYITYTAIEALLYQPLRFILTLKSNRSMIPFGRKHCKYDMHNNFHASFLGIAFKSFIDGKDYCTKSL